LCLLAGTSQAPWRDSRRLAEDFLRVLSPAPGSIRCSV
jgi:hypothetical protein